MYLFFICYFYYFLMIMYCVVSVASKNGTQFYLLGLTVIFLKSKAKVQRIIN